MKPLACVGSAVLDRLFQMSKLPDKPGKFVARGYVEVGGGPAATAAVTVAQLGCAVSLIAPVGQDSTGSAIIFELSERKVDTTWVHMIENATSSVSAVLVDEAGERMIVNHRHPRIDEQPDWLSGIDFGAFGALLSDVRWPRGNLLALERAKAAGVLTVLDADVCPDDMSPLVALADHVAFSEPGLARFTGCTDLEAGLRMAAGRTAGMVYVTAGSEGCYWLDNGVLCHLPAFPLKVVDTTGAGDVFHGALLVALSEGLTGEAAVRIASGAAALKCTRAGGRDGIPNRHDLLEFLGR